MLLAKEVNKKCSETIKVISDLYDAMDDTSITDGEIFLMTKLKCDYITIMMFELLSTAKLYKED